MKRILFAAVTALVLVMVWGDAGHAARPAEAVPHDQGPLYYVINDNGYCLSIAGGSTVPGTRVVEWTCDGSYGEIWQTVWVNGLPTLWNFHSGLCIGLPGGSTVPGTQVITWPCDGSKNQTWGSALPAQDQPIFNAAAPGQCLSIAGGSINAVIWPCNWSADQKWQYF
jgi:hypothetical protein